MRTSTRDDLKQLASTIESLAHEIQNKIDAGSEILTVANELVRNNLTLVFALGEVSAVEQITAATTKPVKNKTVLAKTVKAGKPRNYNNNYKVRDNKSGRFVVKV